MIDHQLYVAALEAADGYVDDLVGRGVWLETALEATMTAMLTVWLGDTDDGVPITRRMVPHDWFGCATWVEDLRKFRWGCYGG